MVVDHEAVLADLEAHIQAKGSWGRRELIEYLAAARARHRVPEGLPEKALRLYGPQLIEVLRQRPATFDPEGTDGMDERATHRVEAVGPHEGAGHGQRTRAVAAV